MLLKTHKGFILAVKMLGDSPSSHIRHTRMPYLALAPNSCCLLMQTLGSSCDQGTQSLPSSWESSAKTNFPSLSPHFLSVFPCLLPAAPSALQKQRKEGRKDGGEAERKEERQAKDYLTKLL